MIRVDRKVSNGCDWRKCKYVRITPEPQVLNCVEILDEMSDQERFHGWWQPDEYEGTKADARTQCRKMRRLGDSDGPLSEAYDQACSIAATSQTDLDAIHSAQVLTPNEGLVHWCSTTNDIRGLERWTCREYALSRGRHANEVKHVVLLEQARQFLSNLQDEEAIALLAQEKSRKARVFAALLGQADAAAAKQDDVPTKKRHSLVGKGIEPTQDLYNVPLDDPVSDESSEGETTCAPIYISIETMSGIQPATRNNYN